MPGPPAKASSIGALRSSASTPFSSELRYTAPRPQNASTRARWRLVVRLVAQPRTVGPVLFGPRARSADVGLLSEELFVNASRASRVSYCGGHPPPFGTPTFARSRAEVIEERVSNLSKSRPALELPKGGHPFGEMRLEDRPLLGSREMPRGQSQAEWKGFGGKDVARRRQRRLHHPAEPPFTCCRACFGFAPSDGEADVEQLDQGAQRLVRPGMCGQHDSVVDGTQGLDPVNARFARDSAR